MRDADGREGGYIKLHRALESSEDFVGLRPDQCWVAVRLMQMANYRPGFMPFRGQAIPIGRGELGHTLETISKRTGASKKVVRTTLSHLMQTGFLGTRTGTVAGTAYRILIVRNYELFQGEDESPGTAAGTAAGTYRARTGHVPGTDRALREEEEEGKKETLALVADAPAPELVPAAPPKRTSPQGEAFDHWRATVWRELSDVTCPQPGPGEMTNLARRCKDHGLLTVKEAMERAADAVRGGDTWLHDNLTLLSFCTTQFSKFLRAPAAPRGRRFAPLPPDAIIRPVER